MIEKLVRQFLYYPTRMADDASVPYFVKGAKEVRFEADDGNTIHGLHWPAPEGRPTILFFHGNAQSVFEWALIEQDFQPLESGLLLVDYPGYGKSTGSPSEEGLYACGRASLKWLNESAGVGDGKILVIGKSLGGGVATEVAQGKNLLGLVLESTFRSIPSVAKRLLPMLPADAVFRSERYASAEKIKNVNVPVLVIHGTRDELIPVEEGKGLFEAANDPKDLYLVDGAGHNDVSWTAGKEYGERLRAWLDGFTGG